MCVYTHYSANVLLVLGRCYNKLWRLSLRQRETGCLGDVVRRLPIERGVPGQATVRVGQHTPSRAIAPQHHMHPRSWRQRWGRRRSRRTCCSQPWRAVGVARDTGYARGGDYSVYTAAYTHTTNGSACA